MEGARKFDTPITTLTKIFSSTGITDPSKKFEMNRSRRPEQFKISSIPQYIDESANQEPPTFNQLDWISSESTILPLIDDSSKSFQSCSSGYFSSSSQSAPPTCCAKIVSQNGLQTEYETLSQQSESTIVSGKRSLCQLRRTQSCTSTWLAKRNQTRQSWPRLSGILRRSSTVPMPSASIHETTLISRRSSLTCRVVSCCPDLSPVGEDMNASIYEDSTNRLKTTNNRSCLISPCGPAAKKQRTDSPIFSAAESPPTASPSNDNNLDATMPLESSLDENSIESIESKQQFNCDPRKKLPFDLFRHQSTPMTTLKDRVSPLFQDKIEHKPPFQLSRCVSVPAFVDAEKFLSGADHASVPKVLPVIERTGAGLNFVDPETVAALVSGRYKEKNVKFIVVDCRFPYEFEGGHVKNALNLYTHNDLIQEVFKRVPAQNPSGDASPKLLGERLSRRLAVVKPELPLPEFSDHSCTEESEILGEQDSDLLEDDPEFQHQNTISMTEQIVSEPLRCRSFQSISQDSGASSRQLQVSSEETSPSEPSFVVIFHCEFSSQRAPHLATFLRRIDRMTNYHRYPFLFFPEIYVMKGGYSEFYKKFPEHCDPNEYVTMFNPDYRNELRLFRRMTKRVSNACQNCLHNSQKPTLDAAVNQPVCSQSENCIEKPITPKKKIQTGCLFDTTIYKENTAPKQFLTWALKVADDRLVSPTIAAMTERKRQTVLNVSLGADSVNSSISSNENELQSRLNYSFEDSSLCLAEAVVRVGQQIVAATLSAKPVILNSDEQLLEMPGSCKSKPNILTGSDGGTPHTPINSYLTRPPLMKLSLQNSPCLETPVFSRRV